MLIKVKKTNVFFFCHDFDLESGCKTFNYQFAHTNEMFLFQSSSAPAKNTDETSA